MKLKKEHSDDRRTIYLVSGLLKNKEFTFIKLNKGKAIGSCIHPVEEGYFVVSGLVYSTIGYIKKKEMIGDGGLIPKDTPHMFEAIEDSIVCEFGVSTKEKMNSGKDEKMREKVDKING